jgi:hypothetical protein
VSDPVICTLLFLDNVPSLSVVQGEVVDIAIEEDATVGTPVIPLLPVVKNVMVLPDKEAE